MVWKQSNSDQSQPGFTLLMDVDGFVLVETMGFPSGSDIVK